MVRGDQRGGGGAAVLRLTLPIAGAILAGATLAMAGCGIASAYHGRPTRAGGAIPGGPAVGGGNPDWPTYHHDADHRGFAPSAPALTPTRAAWTSPTLDGDVYGEPLAADGVIVVATNRDTVYALDPSSGALRWSTHLGNPVPRSALPCGDVDPLGILSTPVVDPSLHRIFVVAEERRPGGAQHELIGLDTRSGKVATRQNVDPIGMNVVAQQQRSSLIIDQGRVVIAFGGLDGDCGRYHGWLVSAGEDGASPLVTYHTPGNGVAMWSTGGPVVDPSGDIFVATGNGNSTTTYDQGNSVLKLSPRLRLLDSFAVSGWATDNSADADLGSTGPILLSGGMLFEAGKRPTGYLLDPNHLGGIGGQVFAGATRCSSFGAQASDGADLYVSCMEGGLRKFTVNSTARTFAPVWVSVAPGDGPPVIGGGAVWSEDWKTGTLYGIDPATGHTLTSVSTGAADHFVSPAIIGDRVVVAAKRRVHAFARAEPGQGSQARLRPVPDLVLRRSP